jgi:hypothetical protein
MLLIAPREISLLIFRLTLTIPNHACAADAMPFGRGLLYATFAVSTCVCTASAFWSIRKQLLCDHLRESGILPKKPGAIIHIVIIDYALVTLYESFDDYVLRLEIRFGVSPVGENCG